MPRPELSLCCALNDLLYECKVVIPKSNHKMQCWIDDIMGKYQTYFMEVGKRQLTGTKKDGE